MRASCLTFILMVTPGNEAAGAVYTSRHWRLERVVRVTLDSNGSDMKTHPNRIYREANA